MSAETLNSFERKKQLFERATANAQRRSRESFLTSLPFDLRSYLEKCDCLFAPEAHEVLHKFYPISETGIGYREQNLPEEYLYFETAKIKKALATANQISSNYDDADGLLLLCPVAETWLEEREKAVLYPTVPLFKVNFGWARKMFVHLWKHSFQCIVLVDVNLTVGVAIDHYCGVLPDEYNEEELVYEVARWG